MKIVICTLRRSGSTVFWKTFRDNTGFRCYDEPFNPGLSVLPKEHRKEVYGEYIDLINEDATLFWRKFSAISPTEENKSSLTLEQKDYLKYLLDSAEDVVIDTTRCWNKLESLKEVLEPYPHVFIHLYRDPIAFVSSHLLPSEIKSWRYNRKLKKEFWIKTEGFNYWKMEEVLGASKNTSFDSLVMTKEETIIENFYSKPAYEKLHLFWSLAFNKVQSKGEELFGNNYYEVQFERFCEAPNAILKDIKEKYNVAFNAMPALDLHQPNLGFDRGNSNWISIGGNRKIK